MTSPSESCPSCVLFGEAQWPSKTSAGWGCLCIHVADHRLLGVGRAINRLSGTVQGPEYKISLPMPQVPCNICLPARGPAHEVYATTWIRTPCPYTVGRGRHFANSEVVSQRHHSSHSPTEETMEVDMPPRYSRQWNRNGRAAQKNKSLQEKKKCIRITSPLIPNVRPVTY